MHSAEAGVFADIYFVGVLTRLSHTRDNGMISHDCLRHPLDTAPNFIDPIL